MTKKLALYIATLLTFLLALPASVFAHVVVTPSKAGLAQELIFNVSVPNERQVSVNSVKLLVPSGVMDVIPTTKEGWTIETAKNKNDEVNAVVWKGGIPAGQRQDFSFSAQVPGKATDLNWKAYQTYSDGTVISWDQKPSGSDDANGKSGPYSVTKVVNDLNAPKAESSDSKANQSGPYVLAGLALLVALFALLRKK